MADTQLPLLGVILCCTSITPEKRSDLAGIASQMGAIHKLDLTSDVTHLVVGDYDTPKYKFVAKERPDVKIVLPSWIEAARVSWLEGGETNVEELEQIHKLPTFTGLRLCVTGFDDLVYRKQLEDSINDNGGDYRGNLTKDVTHLVAKEALGQKYEFAAQWGITIVAVEWLEHSLERGMILDETQYHLSIPPVERGRNAWIRRSESATSLGKRTRGDEIVSQNARKLRRTASARLSSQNVGLWSELVAAPIKIEKPDAWDEQPREAKTVLVPMKSKAEEMVFTPTAVDAHQTLKRSLSEANLGSFLGRPFAKEGLFHGRIVLLRGFDKRKTTIIQEHLRSHGAEIIENALQLPSMSEAEGLGKGLLVVPHTMAAADPSLKLKPTIHPTVVTDLWIERCIFQKRLENPQDHATSTPFSRIPIPGLEDLAICSTGFQGIDLLHVSKAIKSIGGTYSEYFTPQSSVLVCNAVVPGNEKLRHAQRWSVPAVRAGWLWDSIRKGELMSCTPYLIQPLTDPIEQSNLTKESEKLNVSYIARESDGKRSPKRKPVQRKPPPEDRYKHLIIGTSHSTANEQNGSGSDFKPSSKSTTDSSYQIRPQTSDIYLDDDSTIPPDSAPNKDSSNMPYAPSIPTPLQEITPNSSPPKRSTLIKPSSPAKPQKPPSPPPQDPPPASEDSSLGPAISSLLAHHQRSNTRPQSSNSSDPPRLCQRRQRRQLLGRAPSNLSSHSNGVDFSRASSVDTMNTDGLGTPLEPLNNTRNTISRTTNNAENVNNNNNNNNNNDRPTSDLTNLCTTTHHSYDDDDPDRIQEPLQMTQLGYEDPNVAAWRERVAIKLGGGTIKEGKAGRKSAAAAAKEVGRSNDNSNRGESLGIAKRTRLACGGR